MKGGLISPFFNFFLATKLNYENQQKYYTKNKNTSGFKYQTTCDKGRNNFLPPWHLQFKSPAQFLRSSTSTSPTSPHLKLCKRVPCGPCYHKDRQAVQVRKAFVSLTLLIPRLALNEIQFGNSCLNSHLGTGSLCLKLRA